MKQLFIILILCSITSFCSAEDKGWQIAVDKTTGEILGEHAYSTNSMQHRADQGYTIITIPSLLKESVEQTSDFIWRDTDHDGKVEKDEIVKRPQVEIDARKNKETRLKKEKRTVDLEIKKEMAKKKGYTELEAEYQNQIDELNQ